MNIHSYVHVSAASQESDIAEQQMDKHGVAIYQHTVATRDVTDRR